jgi:hypothetical protein
MDSFFLVLGAAIVAVVAFGLALSALARWSVRRNVQLKERYGSASPAEAVKALRNRRWRDYAALTFFGDLGPVEERIGKVLIAAVLICGGGALVWLAVVLVVAANR